MHPTTKEQTDNDTVTYTVVATVQPDAALTNVSLSHVQQRVPRPYGFKTFFCYSGATTNDEQVKPRSLRFTWSMKTTSSRDPNEIMSEIRKVLP